MTLLATLLGLAMIVVLFVAMARQDHVDALTHELADLNAQLDDAQRHTRHLERVRSYHISESSALAVECNALERRNAFLESNYTHRKQVLSASMMCLNLVRESRKIAVMNSDNMP